MGIMSSSSCLEFAGESYLHTTINLPVVVIVVHFQNQTTEADMQHIWCKIRDGWNPEIMQTEEGDQQATFTSVGSTMGCGTFSDVGYIEERCGGPPIPVETQKNIEAQFA